MKKKNAYMLNENGDKAIQLFVKLGMPENLAKTLIFVSQFDECRRVDVQQAIDMRQPEVSVAIQELRRRDWVKKRDLKKKAKGRPVHIYRPVVDLSDILKTFELEKLKEIEAVKNDLSELKNMINNR